MLIVFFSIMVLRHLMGDDRQRDAYLQGQLLHLACPMHPQQGEEQLEVANALRL